MQGSTGLGRCTAELGRSQRETAQRSLRELGENMTSCELGNWNGNGKNERNGEEDVEACRGETAVVMLFFLRYTI